MNVELKIRPDIRYSAYTGYSVPVSGFRLTGYPAKSVSGASLIYGGTLCFQPLLKRYTVVYAEFSG
jgi:hypothetical protein